MERTRKTRSERNHEIDRVELYKPFAFYTVVIAAMNVSVHLNGDFSPLRVIGYFITGLLTWGFYEYATHRWVLHRVPKAQGFNLPGNITHLRHHADPDSLQRLNVQLQESIPVCIVYCLLAWAITGSWQLTTYLYTGLIAGYFFYEFLDFQAHHGTTRNRVVRYFRKYHLLHHHYDAKVRYGVTSPLFDIIFGTYHLKERTSPNRERRPQTVVSA
jgi:sterol desaturase/sphingolipid hydroxylase (fatty acid hydroxylase superfamily)